MENQGDSLKKHVKITTYGYYEANQQGESVTLPGWEDSTAETVLIYYQNLHPAVLGMA